MKAKSMVKGRWPWVLLGLRHMTLVFCLLPFSLVFAAAAAPGVDFNQGVELYKAGRTSEAIESFERAIKRKEKVPEAQDYIDRIRKDTVERIRNKALTGVNKTTWQSKYFFMNEVDNRVHVGISIQEVFERDSLNFRPGAIDALNQLSVVFAKADKAHFDVDLVNEINVEISANPQLTAQQLTTVFSYLSLASRDALPKF